jgi:hypothetical protein
VSLKTCLSLSLCAYFCMGVASCPRQLPPPPELIWGQCALNWPEPKPGEKPRPALYCVDPQTRKCRLNAAGKCLVVQIDAPWAKDAQVLLPQDYNAYSAWWDDVLDIAQRRCN